MKNIKDSNSSSSTSDSSNHELINNSKTYEDILKENIFSYIEQRKQMEFHEIAENMLMVNVTQSHCLISENFNLITLGTPEIVYGFRMKVMNLSNTNTLYQSFAIHIPKIVPTAKIINEVNMRCIYENVNIFERQTVALDPWYAIHFSKPPIPPQILSIATTYHNPLDPLMVIITTFGCCAVLSYTASTKTWKDCKLIVNDCLNEFADIRRANKIRNFKELQVMIDNYVITSGCWQTDCVNSPIYYCSNVSGYIFAVQIINNEAKLLSHMDCGLKEVICMKISKNILVVCSIDGIVQSFEISNETIIRMRSELWSKADNISCGRIIINYCPKYNQYYVVANKTAHLVVFILNSNGTLIYSDRFYVGNIEITGLESITPNLYVVSTLTGFMELYSFEYKNNGLIIIRANIKLPFDIENYHIKGLTASPNKVAWNLLLVPNKFHTGPTRNCQTVTFLKTCSFNAIKPIPLLLKYPSNFGNLTDCLEVMRLDIIKNNSPEIYLNFKPGPIKMNFQFLNGVRIEKLISKFSYVNLKHSYNPVLKNFTAIIEVVILYLRLKHLLSIEKRSDFVKKSGKLMLLSLKIIIKKPYEEDKTTMKYREVLLPFVNSLIEECCGQFADNIDEKCQNCNKAIEEATLRCSDGHKTPRCSISYLTLPAINKAICPNCELSVTIDDFENLRIILPLNEDITCNICNGRIIKNDLAN